MTDVKKELLTGAVWTSAAKYSNILINAKLQDNAGVLSSVMNELYFAGANILADNQSKQNRKEYLRGYRRPSQTSASTLLCLCWNIWEVSFWHWQYTVSWYIRSCCLCSRAWILLSSLKSSFRLWPLPSPLPPVMRRSLCLSTLCIKKSVSPYSRIGRRHRPEKTGHDRINRKWYRDLSADGMATCKRIKVKNLRFIQ